MNSFQFSPFRPLLRFVPAVLLFILISLSPDSALAAPFGNFVNCEGAGCSACDLVKMINEIIKWLFGIIFLIFAVLMLMAGFGLVTSGGDTSAVSAAKSKFQNALIGILIVMAAWLLVDTMMKGLIKGNNGNLVDAGFTKSGPWADVQCQVQTVPLAAKPKPDGGVIPAGSLSDVDARARLREKGITVNKSMADGTSLEGMREATIQNILDLKFLCSTNPECKVVITGGTESTGGHTSSDSGHTAGYKYDVRLDSVLDDYIVNNFTKLPLPRSDGAIMYKGVNGAIFAKEGDHWDVQVK
jgi:Type IV secretion system pilin